MAHRRHQDNNRYFEVVHPLDDLPEQKFSLQELGRMRMTPTVRISLMALRAYLLLMTLLVFYRVFDLAGAFGHH